MIESQLISHLTFCDPYGLDFFPIDKFLVNAIHSTFFYLSLQNLYHNYIHSLIPQMSSKLGKIGTETRSWRQ